MRSRVLIFEFYSQAILVAEQNNAIIYFTSQ